MKKAIYVLIICLLLDAQRLEGSGDKFFIYPAQDLLTPPLTQKQIDKFISTLEDVYKQLSPRLEEDFQQYPLSSMLLEDLKKQKKTLVPIPQDIQKYYERYYLPKYNTAAKKSLDFYLLILLGAEAGADHRVFPKDMITLLNSQNWNDPKEFIRVQFQIMRTLSLLVGLEVAHEAQKAIRSVELIKQTTIDDAKREETLKKIMIKLQDFPEPEAIQAFLVLVQNRLDPQIVALVKPVREKIDRIAKAVQ